MNDRKMNMDDYSGRYFIEMTSAFLNGTSLRADRPVKWDEILYLARIQSMTGILGYMAQMEESEYKAEPKLAEQFFRMYLHNLQVAVNRDVQCRRIMDALCEKKIRHIVMKGIVVRNYYPIKELRSMGDFDFVVHEEDVEEAEKILLEIGYQFLKQSGFVREYTMGDYCAEIHTKLFSSVLKEKNQNIIRYFDDAWEHTQPTENGFTMTLNEEYHLLFLLCHIAKHFYGGKCGIRMILDIAVYLKHFSGTLDVGSIWRELEKLNLRQFAENIFGLCDSWFGVALPDFKSDLHEPIYGMLYTFIVMGGMYGGVHRNSVARQYRMECEKYSNKKRVFLWGRILFQKIFPSAKKISYYHQKAEKNFIFYIAAWFIRAFHLKKGKVLKDLKNGAKDVECEYNILKSIGL